MENDMDSYENGLIYWIDYSDQNYSILIKGTASEVLGMDSDTVLRNTVNDRSIVTSENISQHYSRPLLHVSNFLQCSQREKKAPFTTLKIPMQSKW